MPIFFCVLFFPSVSPSFTLSFPVFLDFYLNSSFSYLFIFVVVIIPFDPVCDILLISISHACAKRGILINVGWCMCFHLFIA